MRPALNPKKGKKTENVDQEINNAFLDRIQELNTELIYSQDECRLLRKQISIEQQLRIEQKNSIYSLLSNHFTKVLHEVRCHLYDLEKTMLPRIKLDGEFVTSDPDENTYTMQQKDNPPSYRSMNSTVTLSCINAKSGRNMADDDFELLLQQSERPSTSKYLSYHQDSVVVSGPINHGRESKHVNFGQQFSSTSIENSETESSDSTLGKIGQIRRNGYEMVRSVAAHIVGDICTELKAKLQDVNDSPPELEDYPQPVIVVSSKNDHSLEFQASKNDKVIISRWNKKTTFEVQSNSTAIKDKELPETVSRTPTILNGTFLYVDRTTGTIYEPCSENNDDKPGLILIPSSDNLVDDPDQDGSMATATPKVSKHDEKKSFETRTAAPKKKKSKKLKKR